MIDAKSTTAYVTLQDSDQLIAIDLATQTPKWTVSVGKTPADVFLTPDQKTLLVALTGDSYVEAYDVSNGGQAGHAHQDGGRRAPSARRATSATCSSATAPPIPSAASTCRRWP